ncbi:MAG: hypothetical protein J6V66_06520 [Clostridia bacterium]|nr:hypothetical protein [Clostridia bacterium]
MTITPEIKKAEILNAVSINLKNAVECKLNIAEEEVSSVIFVSAKANLNSATCLNGEIRYGGKVLFYLILSSGGIKKCEAGVEFSYRQEVKDVKEGEIFIGDITAENVKITVVNGIPTASAMLVLSGRVIKKEYSDYIKDAPEIHVKKRQAENLALVASECKEFDLEEEFDVDFPINEVAWHSETATVNSVSSGIGAVSVEGFVETNFLFCLGDGKLESLKRNILFNFEKEIKFAMPDLIATCKVDVADCNVKIVVDRAKGKSSVAVLLKLSVRTCVYENEPLSFVADAYLETHHLSLEKTPVKIDKILGEKIFEKKVNCPAVSKFDKSTLLVCPIFAKIEEIEVATGNENAKVIGVARVGALLSLDGNYFVETALCPFEIDCGEPLTKAFINRAQIFNVEYSLVGDSLNVDFAVSVAIERFETSVCDFALKVELNAPREKSNSAISVFIPTPGDTLWDVAKSLGVKEEEILKTNGDLVFPLVGDERIVIYKEL